MKNNKTILMAAAAAIALFIYSCTGGSSSGPTGPSGDQPATSVNTASVTATFGASTVTFTQTAIMTGTETGTPSYTGTDTPVYTPTHTATVPPGSTDTDTETQTAVPTDTETFVNTATPTPYDTWEPDNDYTQANALAPGTQQYHALGGADTVDWVKFTLAGTASFTIETGGAPMLSSCVLLLFNQAGVPSSTINWNSGNLSGGYASVTCNDCPADDYYIRISMMEDNPSFYVLLSVSTPTMTNTAPPTNTATHTPTTGPTPDIYEFDDACSSMKGINPGDCQARSLWNTDEDWAHFTINARSAVVITTSGDAGGDTWLQLDNGGCSGWIAQDDDSNGNGYSRISAVLDPGHYGIKVWSKDVLSGNIYNYTLCLDAQVPTETYTPTYTLTNTYTETYTPTVTNTFTVTPTVTNTSTPVKAWSYVGTAQFSSKEARRNRIVIDNTGKIFVAYVATDSQLKPAVMEWGGSSWSSVGTISVTGDISDICLTAFDGKPSVVMNHLDPLWLSSATVTAQAYDTSLGWQALGAGEISKRAVYISAACDSSGVMYISYSDADGPVADNWKASVVKYNGSGWDYVGSRQFSAGYAWNTRLFIEGTTPYLAYEDTVNSNVIRVQKYVSSWQSIDFAGMPAQTAGNNDYSLSVYAGKPYVLFSQTSVNKMTCVKYDTSWAYLGSQYISATQQATDLEIATGPDGSVFAAFVNENDLGRIVVKKYTGGGTTGWEDHGNPLQLPQNCWDVSIAVNASGVPYVAFSEGASKKISVMKCE